MNSQMKFLIGGVIIFATIALLSLQGLQEMTVYFYTPQEVLAAPSEFEDKTIRIGALVQPGSVNWDAENIHLAFNITEDSKVFIPVVYKGVKPDMFKEGQGVVVEGKVQNNVFHADQLLVKHSEDYKLDPNDHQAKKDYYKTLSAQ